MYMVTSEDTLKGCAQSFMTAHEAILREQYSRLAIAKQTLEELHDNGDLQTACYYTGTTELGRCMAAVDELISGMQFKAELKPNGVEITRLRIW